MYTYIDKTKRSNPISRKMVEFWFVYFVFGPKSGLWVTLMGFDAFKYQLLNTSCMKLCFQLHSIRRILQNMNQNWNIMWQPHIHTHTRTHIHHTNEWCTNFESVTSNKWQAFCPEIPLRHLNYVRKLYTVAWWQVAYLN